MKNATIIYPHQLVTDAPAVAAATAGAWPIYLIEEPLLFTQNPIHRQKLIFHKLSIDAYHRELESAGTTVVRISITDHPKTTDVFARLKKDGIGEMHIADTTDSYLERTIKESGIARVWYDSSIFILPKEEATKRFTKSKRFMASFYKQLRKDKNILMNDDGTPAGGDWSFDTDNRKKLPKNIELPDDIRMFGNQETRDAVAWAKAIEAEQYGESGCWLPYTHAGAEEFLQEFLCTRFHNFGPYEDALSTRGTRLFHSTLSPLLNVGLLTPQQVIDAALAYADAHDVPINSLEGFVRQILGWREFMRASYECDGSAMRRQNFWGHTRALPDSFWTGTTDIEPLDTSITRALRYGYTHHIERLMILGNFMLLAQVHPDAVYRWFMGMYLDAYDWVMVPNVYGMSQFADGGSFATKPYISGSNYLKKMSDYEKGDWEELWTALYWHFIETHQDVFVQNYRLSMMPRLLDKMDTEKRAGYRQRAEEYFGSL